MTDEINRSQLKFWSSSSSWGHHTSQLTRKPWSGYPGYYTTNEYRRSTKGDRFYSPRILRRLRSQPYRSGLSSQRTGPRLPEYKPSYRTKSTVSRLFGPRRILQPSPPCESVDRRDPLDARIRSSPPFNSLDMSTTNPSQLPPLPPELWEKTILYLPPREILELRLVIPFSLSPSCC